MSNIKIRIESITSKGEGVGRYNNFVIFVPHSVPGDYVEVSFISKKSSYGRALISEIIEPSPFRVKPKCPKILECGGCQLQEIEYNQQLKQKEIILKDSFSKIAGITSIIQNSIIPSDLIFEYRNKCQYPIKSKKNNKLSMGYYALRSHDIINFNNCYLHPPQLNKALKQVKEILEYYKITGYDEKTHKGSVRHLIGRFSFKTNDILIGIVTNESILNSKLIGKDIINTVPSCKGVIENINPNKTNVILGNKNIILAGENSINEIIGEMKFYYSLSSFFQINTLCTEKLYNLILQISNLKGKEVIVDAYSGVGTISLFLARFAQKVYAIEEIESSINDGIKNASINNIKNCVFKHGKVEWTESRIYY